ncbi:MAG: BrnA antitoxin family protein [Promicromonosporaceae bacterium]|nr:BrnA antitoxin family protein [Promicromonosporaceae bacterium]
MITKTRKTLTLDVDVVEAFSASDPDNLSGAINAVLREEHERRVHRASLHKLAEHLAEIYGEPDPDVVAETMELLS